MTEARGHLVAVIEMRIIDGEMCADLHVDDGADLAEVGAVVDELSLQLDALLAAYRAHAEERRG